MIIIVSTNWADTVWWVNSVGCTVNTLIGINACLTFLWTWFAFTVGIFVASRFTWALWWINSSFGTSDASMFIACLTFRWTWWAFCGHFIIEISIWAFAKWRFNSVCSTLDTIFWRINTFETFWVTIDTSWFWAIEITVTNWELFRFITCQIGT